MEKDKQRLIERMEKLQSLIPDTIRAVNELPVVEFDCHLMTVLDPGKLCVEIDYDVEKYKLLRRKLNKNWRFIERHFNKHLGCYFAEFQHESLDVKLDIKMRVTEEGETCKLIVDHYTNPQPVYRVECK